MIVIANGNYLFRGAHGESYLLKRGVLISDLPSWVAQSAFYKALCQDGKIAVSESKKDKAVEAAVEEASVKETVVKEQKKAKKKTEETPEE